jgi:hypothetical protein
MRDVLDGDGRLRWRWEAVSRGLRRLGCCVFCFLLFAFGLVFFSSAAEVVARIRGFLEKMAAEQVRS